MPGPRKHWVLELCLMAMQKERLEKARLGKLRGESLLMQRIFDKIRQASRTDNNVLLLGESGTGKGVVAETIHDLSQRKNQRLVKVNCAALYQGLLESELFGHEKGSFTGAVRQKIGKFEFADIGTLFLDEIGEIPAPIQAKLLHAVEDKEIQRIGGNRPIRINTRIIAATNTNIKEALQKKSFRPDLYYRLNTDEISLPPLRKREADAPLLAEHFLKEFGNGHHQGLSLASYEKLVQYDWPGNVRELRSVIHRAVARTPQGGWIEPHHLEMDSNLETRIPEERPTSLSDILGEYERDVIVRALQRNEGNVTKAAEELSLTRSGLHKKIIRLRICRDEYLS